MSDKFEKECFLCGTASDHDRNLSKRGGSDFYRCPNCGEYITIDYFLSVLDGCKHIIAGYLFGTKGKRETIIELDREEVARILKDPKIPKTVMQKIEELLLYLYLQNDAMGTAINPDEIPSAAAYAKNQEEIYAFLWSMAELGWIVPCVSESSVPHMEFVHDFYLTVQGFEYAEQLNSTNIDSRKVFVAMGFKQDLLEAHEKAIVPACDDCGFVASLISSKEHNNGITDEIITEIKRSKFVIVDFTYNNCGAYFEAGYAQGLGREIIRCCKKEWFDEKDENGSRVNELHFDVRHYNTILWEDLDDLRQKLKARIRATVTDAKLED